MGSIGMPSRIAFNTTEGSKLSRVIFRVGLSAVMRLRIWAPRVMGMDVSGLSRRQIRTCSQKDCLSVFEGSIEGVGRRRGDHSLVFGLFSAEGLPLPRKPRDSDPSAMVPPSGHSRFQVDRHGVSGVVVDRAFLADPVGPISDSRTSGVVEHGALAAIGYSFRAAWSS